MSLSVLFLSFLQPIAVGTTMVLILFLLVRLGMPRRSVIGVDRRQTDDGSHSHSSSE